MIAASGGPSNSASSDAVAGAVGPEEAAAEGAAELRGDALPSPAPGWAELPGASAGFADALGAAEDDDAVRPLDLPVEIADPEGAPVVDASPPHAERTPTAMMLPRIRVFMVPRSPTKSRRRRVANQVKRFAMPPRPRHALLALGIAGCSAQTPLAEEQRGEAVGVDVTAPHPSSTSATPRVSASPPLAARDACVMLYECGCNSACVTVDQPRVGFREGDLVMVKSGSLKGEEVYVVKNDTVTGGLLWTVQRADPRAGVHVCGHPGAEPFLGYACATSNSGPPRPCFACEEE